MKKIVYVIIITLLLFAIVIFEQIFVDNTLNNIIIAIDKLDYNISQNVDISTGTINTQIEYLDNYWTEKEKVLCLIINHNDLNKVGEQIKKVKVYINQNNKESCVIELETLKFYAESYKHVMELNLQNLL